MLKLVYLEMVGHDMSWASFHVLEVMSSPKYHQKRVGYLGAVQSFRPDTEVLMLATNLLKKVICSTVMALPQPRAFLTSFSGPRLDYPDDHLPPDRYSAARHHTIAGPLHTPGSASPDEP